MDLNSFISNKDFLPWLIPVGPLLAFLIITLLTNRSHLIPATSEEYGGHHPDYEGMLVHVVTRTSRIATVIVGVTGIVLAWVLALATVGNAFAIEHLGEHEVIASSVTWFDAGVNFFRMGVLVDPLTTIMLIMVPLACTCIFVYSIGYMAHDPRQSRFFSMIALFAGAMLTLVVADNLLLLFIGWEVMGLCSYLLVGFWFEKESAYKAAIKAFITTRVADVIMLLGIAYLYASTGTLSFRDIVHNQAVLDALAATPSILGLGISAASLIGIFLVIGTIGKSAQFPLHVWLPDAMEGPTPVSAMIHAAAMVSAGIYAIIRMYPLLSAGADPHHGILSPPMVLMSVVGAFTALFAATIAVAQNDVKKVLAYSTISQLGFMMAALGIGAYIAAAFHLITHAFFKALLFMASGAVIHGMEHGEHHVHAHAHGHGSHGATTYASSHDSDDTHAAAVGDEAGEGHPAEAGAHIEVHAEHPTKRGPVFDPQDMMNMGGLRKTMPVTFYTFLIGGLSLAGFPLLTAGFWSKDEILADAWLGTTEGFFLSAIVFICLSLAAFLTAFYTMRQLGLTFWGDARTEEAKHASLGTGIVPVTMTAPLIVLAVFAVLAGFVGVHPNFPILGGIFSPNGNPFHDFVGGTLLEHPESIPFNIFVGGTLLEHPESIPFNIFPVLVSFTVALGGLYVGYRMYWAKPLVAGEPDPLVARLGNFYPTLKNKYYVDELYGRIFVTPLQWFAKTIAYEFFDKGVIDGLLHLIGRAFTWVGDLLKNLNLWLIDGVGDGIPILIGRFGGWIRWIQSGQVQQYMLLVIIAALIIGIVFALSTGALQAASLPTAP